MAEAISFRPSAFSSLGLNDTFDFRNKYQKAGSTLSSMRSTDTESIIPELTGAEELAIKRASTSLAPVKRTTKPTTDLEKWSIEGTESSIDTKNWNEDKIEVTQQGPHHRVQFIPGNAKAITPDSVGSSGVIRISRDDGRYRDIDARRLQNGAEETQAKSLFSYAHYAQSTRQIVTQLQTTPSEDIPDVETENGEHEVRSSKMQPNEKTIQQAKHKKTYCLPKFVVLLVFLMTLIAGVVALIVKFQEPSTGSNRGNIVSDEIRNDECEDQSFQLGESFEFSCTIAIDHEYRHDLNRARLVKIAKHNTVSEPYFIGWSNNSPIVTYSPGKTVTCSSEGLYNLEFLDQDNVTIYLRHPISLKITIKPSHVNVTFEQRLVDNCTKPDTYFDATCIRSNDCHSYQPSFFRRIYGSDDSLNHLMNCSYTYTDTAGYTINCSARFPDKLLENNVYLGCRMTSQTDQSRDREEMFTLPTCDLDPSCTKKTRDVPYSGFNCSEKSDHLRALNVGNCSFPYLKNCFKGRSLFRYYKDGYGDLSCNDDGSEDTKAVCRLSWCRDFYVIVTKEIPGIAICGESYIEPGYN